MCTWYAYMQVNRPLKVTCQSQERAQTSSNTQSMGKFWGVNPTSEGGAVSRNERECMFSQHGGCINRMGKSWQLWLQSMSQGKCGKGPRVASTVHMKFQQQRPTRTGVCPWLHVGAQLIVFLYFTGSLVLLILPTVTQLTPCFLNVSDRYVSTSCMVSLLCFSFSKESSQEGPSLEILEAFKGSRKPSSGTQPCSRDTRDSRGSFDHCSEKTLCNDLLSAQGCLAKPLFPASSGLVSSLLFLFLPLVCNFSNSSSSSILLIYTHVLALHSNVYDLVVSVCSTSSLGMQAWGVN